jgi:hypothetical protein
VPWTDRSSKGGVALDLDVFAVAPQALGHSSFNPPPQYAGRCFLDGRDQFPTFATVWGPGQALPLPGRPCGPLC